MRLYVEHQNDLRIIAMLVSEKKNYDTLKLRRLKDRVMYRALILGKTRSDQSSLSVLFHFMLRYLSPDTVLVLRV